MDEDAIYELCTRPLDHRPGSTVMMHSAVSIANTTNFLELVKYNEVSVGFMHFFTSYSYYVCLYSTMIQVKHDRPSNSKYGRLNMNMES